MSAQPDPSLSPEDLDAFLAGPEPSWDDEPAAPTPERVDAMVYRLRRLLGDRARDEVAARLRIAQIEGWLEERHAVYDAQESWLRAALRRYHAAVLSLRSTAKSITLPSGTLRSRMGQPKWEVEDETFLRWAVPQPVAARLAECFRRFEDDLGTVLGDSDLAPTRPAVKVAWKPAVEISRSGLKELLTRRDEKGKPVAWGMTESGEKPPGVTVTDPERQFDVVFGDEEGDER